MKLKVIVLGIIAFVTVVLFVGPAKADFIPSESGTWSSTLIGGNQYEYTLADKTTTSTQEADGNLYFRILGIGNLGTSYSGTDYLQVSSVTGGFTIKYYFTDYYLSDGFYHIDLWDDDYYNNEADLKYSMYFLTVASGTPYEIDPADAVAWVWGSDIELSAFMDLFIMGEYYEGYYAGLSEGYSSGNLDGYSSGYDVGVSSGYSLGVIEGYDDALSDVGWGDADLDSYDDDSWQDGYNAGVLSEINFSWFGAVLDGIEGIFTLEIWPGVSIGLLISIPIMFAVVRWFLKMVGK